MKIGKILMYVGYIGTAIALYVALTILALTSVI